MKIVFNLTSVGLGNNGGSRTLIKCAETLQDLGHEVCICSKVNRYQWEKVKVEVTRKIPPCDVIIATGYHSVSSTLQFKVGKSTPKKFYYIRGFEKWVVPEENLVKSYRNSHLKCIVNSEWLQIMLRKECGVESELVYPGLDFNDFYVESQDRDPVLGGIFSNKHTTKRHVDVLEIGKRLRLPVKLLNHDIKHASPDQLREFYNTVMVWMSPSELEGLHNPPQEASLCGASLVGTDHPRGGIQDYAQNEQTALLYPAQDTKEAVAKVKRLIGDNKLRVQLQRNMQELLRNKIGDRRHNMKKFADILEN
jgi:hypothetical protein